MLNKVDGNVLDYKAGNSKIIIVHCCNNANKFGAGFALALANKWPVVKQRYHDWYKYGDYNELIEKFVPFQLGKVQFVEVDDFTIVCNMLGQSGVGYQEIGGIKIRSVKYDCLEEAMLRVREFALYNKYEIVAPYFSCNLAGGSEEELLKLIDKVWSDIQVHLVRFKQ